LIKCPAKGGETEGGITMYIAYILQNKLTKKYYIGSTNNIIRRLSEHNRGQTKSTKRKGEWIIVYKEVHGTNIEAKRRERMIKSYKGGNAFKRLVSRA